jgi:cell division protein FtsL
MSSIPNVKDYDLDKYLEVETPNFKEIRAKRKEREKALFVMKALRYGIAIFIMVIAICLVRIGFQVEKDALSREIAYLEEQIQIQESEATRLEMELARKFSTEEIEKFAKEHGMVKAEAYQITYIDLSEGDKVIVSGGKDVPTEEDSLWYKIKNFFGWE